MRKVSYCLVVASALLSWTEGEAQTYTDADKEQARVAAQYYKQKYWGCLTKEASEMLKSNVSVADFKEYLPGTCQTEKQDFRVPFIDYLAMVYPEIAAKEHFAQFDYVAQAAIDVAVSSYVKAKNGQ
jgi:hypothetical protein